MNSALIIDAHAHIFPEKIAAKAVNAIGEFYNIKMSENGMLNCLLANAEKAGISASVVSSTATVKEQVKSINRFILSCVSGGAPGSSRPTTLSTLNSPLSTLIGLITLHPDMSIGDIDEEIKFAKDNNLKGIKLHPDFQKFYIDDINAEKIYSSAQDAGLSVLVHTGDDRYDYSQPARLVRVAKKFKKLKFCGAHFGGYQSWDKVKCYHETPNVYFDTSSSLFKISEETAAGLIDEFKPERFMFGTDFPMWNQSEELSRFFRINLSENENNIILSKTALRFYGVS